MLEILQCVHDNIPFIRSVTSLLFLQLQWANFKGRKASCVYDLQKKERITIFFFFLNISWISLQVYSKSLFTERKLCLLEAAIILLFEEHEPTCTRAYRLSPSIPLLKMYSYSLSLSPSLFLSANKERGDRPVMVH